MTPGHGEPVIGTLEERVYAAHLELDGGYDSLEKILLLLRGSEDPEKKDLYEKLMIVAQNIERAKNTLTLNS